MKMQCNKSFTLAFTDYLANFTDFRFEILGYLPSFDLSLNLNILKMKECNLKRGEIRRDNRTLKGVLLLIIGFVLLGRNFHFIPGNVSRILFTWQMLIIGIGILLILVKGKTVGGLFLIGTGSIFLLDKLFPFSPFQWQIAWPLMFIFVGALLVVSYLGKSLKDIRKSNLEQAKTTQKKPKDYKSKYANVEFDIDKIEPIED